ncbi:MAG: formylglycine-generating enzyme family protein [Saprospiraceae bacterium]
MQPPYFIETLPDDTSFKMILVEGGSYDIGNSGHKVTVPSFFIGEFPVTQAVWKAVMNGANPSTFKGDQRSVETVSWHDAKDFIEKLNLVIPKGNLPYRLPSEAEWEFAARGGILSEGYEYAGSNKLKEVGWYRENSYGETKPVGLKFPNELGIYDMSGNVWEWCEDDWHRDFNGAPKDGSAWIDSPERGVGRVRRGGGYFYGAGGCRSANRDFNRPDDQFDGVGFRLVVPSQSVG